MVQLDVVVWGVSAVLALSIQPPPPSAAAAASKKLTSTTTAPTSEDLEEKVPDALPARYRFAKYATWLMDYSFLISFLWLSNIYLKDDGFTFRRIYMVTVGISFATLTVDLIKAALFSDILAKAKINHLNSLVKQLTKLCNVAGIQKLLSFVTECLLGYGLFSKFKIGSLQRSSVIHHIFYFCKIGVVIIPFLVAVQAHLGLFEFQDLFETIAVYGEGELYELKVRRICVVYFEYLFASFLKDAICMDLLHQMMHNRWYSHHHIHHLPMKELSLVNAFYFDVMDLIAEDGIGPLLVIAIKGISGAPARLHLISFVFILLMDQNVHSLMPYTISFFNPLLDSIMKPAMSHNLHHALNSGHYTIWPLHQIKGMCGPKYKGEARNDLGYEFMEYNKVFNTSFLH